MDNGKFRPNTDQAFNTGSQEDLDNLPLVWLAAKFIRNPKMTVLAVLLTGAGLTLIDIHD